jgi:hypothetical protein
MPGATWWTAATTTRRGAGEHTVSGLEELFPVTRSTIYRAIARAGRRAAANAEAADVAA